MSSYDRFYACKSVSVRLPEDQNLETGRHDSLVFQSKQNIASIKQMKLQRSESERNVSQRKEKQCQTFKRQNQLSRVSISAYATLLVQA